MRGPATAPLPCYQTRIRAGTIEVTRSWRSADAPRGTDGGRVEVTAEALDELGNRMLARMDDVRALLDEKASRSGQRGPAAQDVNSVVDVREPG